MKLAWLRRVWGFGFLEKILGTCCTHQWSGADEGSVLMVKAA